MKKSISSRLLSLVLVLSLVCGLAVPAMAAPGDDTVSSVVNLPFEKVDAGISVKGDSVDETAEVPAYALNDVVRVSIVMEKPATLAAGFSTRGVAQNAEAMSYRDSLKANQAKVTAEIEKTIGNDLDVVWNMTLAANIISANVKFGQIEKIEKVAGVKEVVIENRYEPIINDPETSTSGIMTGAAYAWAEGYTGAGSKVAVIDTGIDDDHQSFAESGYNYSMSLNAEAAGMTLDEYKASVGVLTMADIQAVADQLNAPVDASKTYLSDKVPFIYNYVDENFTINHDSDTQGEHGSHVEGIAAANAYIPNADGTFSEALSTVMVKGAAPDAQIVAMKVFGAGGGAYDSDYMVAIEDAVILGCDSVNLSLGSGSAGMVTNPTYQNILDMLAESDTVVVMSAGNSYSWPQYSANTYSYLYIEDVNMDTAGSPGSYVNTLGVASVDNAGTTGMPLKFGDLSAFYTETSGYTNPPIASTIPGENDFVYIDCPAVDGSGANLLTPYAELVEGKVVLVNRGTSSFYQKMDAVAEVGGIACIVVNNQEGTINMDLSSATAEIPCVSITLADGLAIKAAYEKTNDGTYDIYTGTLTVSTEVESVMSDSPYHVMSDFSSWGIPGALILKPEITAPGGNIFSVNGAQAGGTAYEVMSGTSMAAPQITGLVAVLGQYIRENDLCEKTGMSQRHLANSLLMSTAVPVFEDYGEYGSGYWSVLKQGSGLASVINAVHAGSYILMGEDATASYADGKVKAELGDDPDRTGEYSFTFSINNFSDKASEYTLCADFFTQDVTSDGKMLYMDTWTAPLAGTVSFTVNGETFEPVFGLEADVDNDGDTDADDAQAVLNYVVDNTVEINMTAADVDGDGNVTSYDAYLILSNAETTSFEVAAGESAQVEVSFKMDEDQKEFLDAYYTNGAYVEGFVYAEPVGDAEGVVNDVTHSIPVIGFYGNWTDASMYDAKTYAGAAYGDPKASYPSVSNSNMLTVRYDGTNNTAFTGNPYGIEDSFPADKLALSNSANVYQAKITLIRNAAALAPFAMDESGKVLWLGSVTKNALSAYYYVNGGTWQNTTRTVTINKAISSLKLSEGDKVTIGLVAVPEYYGTSFDADSLTALLESGELGDGAFFANTYTVDNTDPELLGVSKDLFKNTLTVTASDNENVAYLAVCSKGGTIIAGGIPTDVDENGVATVTIDLNGASLGKECLIVAADYAGNEAAYSVEMGGGEEAPLDGRMFGFTNSAVRGSGNRWVEIKPETVWFNESAGVGEGLETFATTDVTVLAADYVDGYVFMATADGIFVADANDMGTAMKVGKANISIVDMAYNTVDGQLYALTADKALYTVDMSVGTQTLVATLTGMTSDPRGLAIDDEGNLYMIDRSKYFYKNTLDEVVDGSLALTKVTSSALGTTSGYMYLTAAGSMAWDHDTDTLYLAASYSLTKDYDNKLWTIDLETNKASLANPSYHGEDTASSARPSCLEVCVRGLFVVPSSAAVPPVTAPTSIELSAESMTMLCGLKSTLTADVYPWNLADKSVTWETSDASIVSVDENGNVEALAVGTATVTATTVATPALSASCVVTVEPVPVASMSGLIYAADGTPNWSDFSSDAPASATVLAQGSAYQGGALVGDTLYVNTGDELFAVDADTFAATSLGEIASDWLYADGAELPEQFQAAYGGKVVAPCYGGTYLEILDPEAGSLSYWSAIATYYADDPMAVIAYVGPTTYQTYTDALLYYVITEGGELWAFTLFNGSSLNRRDLGNVGIELGDVSSVVNGYNASMIYDAETGYLFLASYNPDVNDKTAVMYAIDPVNLIAVPTGTFGEDVWPATALYQYARVTDLSLKVTPAEVEMYEGTTAELTIKIKGAQADASFTVASDNEAVATVDENGVITAVSVGTANVTVTTVETNAAGEQLSVVVPVTVNAAISLNATINAQIATDYVNDVASYVTIDLSDMSTSTLAAAELAYDAGGVAGGLKYGMYGNYFVDDATGSGYNFASYPNYIACDMANNPAFTNSNGSSFANSVLYPTTTDYLVNFDAVNGDLGAWNFSTKGYDLVAIAYCGAYEDDDFGINNVFFALGADGKVYTIEVYESSVTAGATAAYASLAFETGLSFSSKQAVSMSYIWDHTEDGLEALVIADAATMNMYAVVDPSGDAPAASFLGSVDGELISSLFNTDWDYIDDLTPASGDALVRAKALGERNRANVAVNLADMTAVTESLLPVNEVTGSTNVVGHGVETKAMLRTPADVVVNIVEAEDATNGKYVVTYNPEDLTFVSASSDAMYAVNTAEGTVTVAVATAEAIPAGDVVAALCFTRNTTGATTVTIATEELNDEVDLDASEDLVLESTVHECPKVFDDVKVTDWFHEAVDYVVANGIMVGVSDTTFAPNAVLTRAQMVTILYRMAGTPEFETDKSFSDVKEGAWYYDAVQWAVANGITNGMGDGTFAPNKEMTRVELVAFLAKYAKLEGKYVAADADLTVFTDAGQVAAWATEYMNWAVANGLINGSNGKLNPKGTATRAQVAKVIMTYLETI